MLARVLTSCTPGAASLSSTAHLLSRHLLRPSTALPRCGRCPPRKWTCSKGLNGVCGGAGVSVQAGGGEWCGSGCGGFASVHRPGLLSVCTAAASLVRVSGAAAGHLPVNGRTAGHLPVNGRTAGLVPVNGGTAGHLPVNLRLGTDGYATSLRQLLGTRPPARHHTACKHLSCSRPILTALLARR